MPRVIPRYTVHGNLIPVARRRQDLLWSIVAWVLALLFVFGSLSLALWFHREAPCWIYQVQNAPVRCLPGGTP